MALQLPVDLGIMTEDEIGKAVREQYHTLAKASMARNIAENNLRFIRRQCRHTQTQTWTETNGFGGSFKVEKCLICGLQRDGSLKYE
jgi:hypothetical protein